LTIVLRQIQRRQAAEAWSERASRRLAKACLSGQVDIGSTLADWPHPSSSGGTTRQRVHLRLGDYAQIDGPGNAGQQ